ncbi:YdcF family protein [Austwickia chelonae]|uniref:YdcF family protein n=1 Tax=Austwickia chelonae TaxID=100225 RepID=UPI0013C36BE1|nr:YdcF family protein [Austwickia chelonae]
MTTILVAGPTIVTFFLGWTFVYRLRKDTGRVTDGFLLIATLGAAAFSLIAWSAVLGGSLGFSIVVALMALSVPLVFFVVVGALVTNGVLVMFREGIGITTLLPLSLGTAMVLVPAATVWSLLRSPTSIFAPLAVPAVAMLCVGIYIVMHLVAYIAYAVAHSHLPVPEDAEVVITLGAGLAGARVTPLLAARLDQALEVRALAPDPEAVYMVTSGGQGPDELVSEAVAMGRYLQERGIDPCKILLEDLSRTTEENIRFSYLVLDENGLEDANVVVCTNDFHAVRTAVIVRRLKAGMKVVGSHTAGYYRPAAFLREFVALLAERSVRHLTMSGLITVLVFLLYLA